MRKGLYLAAAAAAVVVMASNAQAALTLTGNYLQVGISEGGTFGSNGNTPPGIQHDPTGTGTFGPTGDYLTPGSPHDGFAFKSTETGMLLSDNQGPRAFGNSAPVGAVVAGYSIAATWSGATSQVAVTNTYYFNPGDQAVHVRTEITALENLTNASFGRSVDPDPDVITHSTFSTNNSRGNSSTGSADLVTSSGVVSGLVLGIRNDSGNTYAHNTGISGFCCNNDDPDNVLAGYGAIFPLISTGDEGLQMAWALGDLLRGTTVVIDYSYVVGDNRDTVGGVPEPATLALIGTGIAALGVIRRRRRAA